MRLQDSHEEVVNDLEELVIVVSSHINRFATDLAIGAAVTKRHIALTKRTLMTLHSWLLKSRGCGSVGHRAVHSFFDSVEQNRE